MAVSCIHANLFPFILLITTRQRFGSASRSSYQWLSDYSPGTRRHSTTFSSCIRWTSRPLSIHHLLHNVQWEKCLDTQDDSYVIHIGHECVYMLTNANVYMLYTVLMTALVTLSSASYHVTGQECIRWTKH